MWRVLMALLMGGGFLVTGGLTAGLAQSDPASLLVGKWEGTQQQAGRGGSEDRTLIISSVTQQDGKWVADGRYGVQGGAKVRIDVDVSGRWPSLRWTMANGNVVQLDLPDEKTLTGKVTLVGASQRDRDRPVTLDKKQ